MGSNFFYEYVSHITVTILRMTLLLQGNEQTLAAASVKTSSALVSLWNCSPEKKTQHNTGYQCCPV